MAPKKKAVGSDTDLGILDVAAPSLDQRLGQALKISQKLAGKWNLAASAITNPGLSPQSHRRRVFSSGISSLDAELGIGGFPRGHITELFGQPGAGKTLTLYKFISSVQHQCILCNERVEYRDQVDKRGNPITQMVDYMVKGEETKIPIVLRESECTYCHGMNTGGLVILFDQENSSDPIWMTKQEIELTKLIVAKLPSGEMTTEYLRTLLVNVKPEAVCIDSISQLQPKAEQERSDVDDPNLPGLHAKVMAKLCRHITSVFTMDPDAAPAVVWVNQVRADMSGYNQPKTTGGFAPEFYSSIRLYFLPQGLVNQKDPSQGRMGKITIYKGRVAPGLYRKTIDYILTPEGFDKAKDLYDIAIKRDIFNKSKLAGGGHFLASDVNLENKLASKRDEMIDRFRKEPDLYRQVQDLVLASTEIVEPAAIYVGDEVPGQEALNVSEE